MGASLSPACMRRQVVQTSSTSKARCALCRERPVWSKCGTRVPCASLGARGHRGHALLEEASVYLQQRSAAAALPQEMPPAMNLLHFPKPCAGLPSYLPTPEWLSPYHCRLCLEPVDPKTWPQSLHDHLAQHHSLTEMEYRSLLLGDARCGLSPTPPQLLRARLAAYRESVAGPQVLFGVCACCARSKPNRKLVDVTFGLPAKLPAWLEWPQLTWANHSEAWMSRVDNLLNCDSYWSKYFLGPERLAAAEEDSQQALRSDCAVARVGALRWQKRVRTWADNIQRDLALDAVTVPWRQNKWLLYLPACATRACDDGAEVIQCFLCSSCCDGFRKLDSSGRPAPFLSIYARARGLWAGPEPAPIKNLNWLGRRILQLGRAVVCVKHLPQGPGVNMDPAATPLYTVGNVHVFPQKAAEISRSLGLLPLDLCCDIGVQYPGSHIRTAMSDPDMRVSLKDLREALWWFCQNNWEWMIATRNDHILDEDHLGARLEDLLHAYEADGLQAHLPLVPSSLAQSATATQCGDEADVTVQEAATGGATSDFATTSAAYLDDGIEDASPLGMWTAAMRKYDVLLECEKRLLADRDPSRKAASESARALALWQAVQALQRLSQQDVVEQLQAFERARQEHALVLDLGRSDQLLDSNQASFWAQCFCDLFYRSDCRERSDTEPATSALRGRQWARALFKRQDFRGWVASREFAAVAANVFMRRDQMVAVHNWLRLERGFVRIQDTLNSLSVEDFVAAAAAQQGDFQSLAHALQCKPERGARLHQLFREMSVVLRDIDGSEAHRSSTVYKMRALRVWAGCSFLFFTINPGDHHNPIFVNYLSSETDVVKQFDVSDDNDHVRRVFNQFKQKDRMFFAKMAAKHPCAAMRCVRCVMERTIDTLLNCSPAANKSQRRQHLDLIAANNEPGVWQYVAAYFGVVETTKALREYLHMLVHVLGFSHPEDLFKACVGVVLVITLCLLYLLIYDLDIAFVFLSLDDIILQQNDQAKNFAARLSAVWKYIASICFHSEESFARYCNTDAGFETLRTLPLMPVTPKQQEILKGQVECIYGAQLSARGLLSIPDKIDVTDFWQPWPSSHLADASLSASDWTRLSAQIAHSGTLKFGNHVCLSHVCYKKPNAKKAFCRMLYWHWKERRKHTDELVAYRVHGLPLQPHSASHQMPIHACVPHRGLPALERTHPFHFKMTPAVILGGACNHDLSLLFRFPCYANPSGEVTEPSLEEQNLLLKEMIETITDHEYYTGGYMAKGGDHVQGLLHCLHDATLQHSRWKSCATPTESATSGPAAENAKRLFRRLIFALNKRHRLGFQSVYAYLFGKPSVYSSHSFVYLNLTAIFRSCEAAISTGNFAGVSSTVEAEHPESYSHAPPASKAPTYVGYDYQWRSRCLEHAFFTAGTDVVTRATTSALPWPVLQDEAGEKRRHPCYERRMEDDRFVLRSQSCREPDGQRSPLHHPRTGEVLRLYDHYRQLRTHTPWRVPELVGYVPPRCHDLNCPEQCGRYALFAMLLFRPWRNTRAALSVWSGLATCRGLMID